MNAPRLNLDYLNLYQEIPLFCALALRSLFGARAAGRTGSILIVNASLIGEFAASLPAIRDCILRHPGVAVDLVVAPPLMPLAERVRGVRAVYTARSLYGRRDEVLQPETARPEGPYDEIFVMRMSRDIYRLLRGVPARSVRTGLREYSGYALHLWGSLLRRGRPKQWRELNFEMLGGTPRELAFDEIFDSAPEDEAALDALNVLRTEEKKVIIHTGASWPMKHWSTDNWIQLLAMLHERGGLRFIFVGGTEDEADFARISSALPFPLYSLISRIDLWRLALVLRASDYFIGVDSGPRNLAHLAGVRSVCIFGPGPHFYLPTDARDAVLDKSRGRGLFQMFVRTKRGFIDRISAAEAYDAFIRVWNSSAAS